MSAVYEFKVIQLVDADDTTVESTDVPEDEFSAWDNVTTYGYGAQVVSDHAIWYGLLAGNLNHDPATSPLYWRRIGPTNAWSCFDYSSSTATTTALTAVDMVLTPGKVDAAHVVASLCDSVTLVVLDAPGGTEIFNQTETFAGATVPAWVGRFADPFYRRDKVTFTGIPRVAACVMTFSFAGADGLTISTVAVGSTDWLGDTLAGAKPRTRSRARVDTDNFLTRTFTPGGYSIGVDASVKVDRAEFNKVVQIANGLLNKPAVWLVSCSDWFDSLQTLGFLTAFEPELGQQAATYAVCSAQVEGL